MTSRVFSNPGVRLRCLLALGLAAAVAVVYGQVFGFDFLLYDDDTYVSANPNLREGVTLAALHWAFNAGYASNWHPLTWMSHLLDVQLFGLNPGAHHLVNLFWHTANSVLLFVLLGRLTGAPWRSALVAALFALHPLHVESVAWIAERKDLLSTFCFLLTLDLYARHAANPGKRCYLAALAVFALGLMAKPMLVTLPGVLLLLDLWPLGRWRGLAVAAPAGVSTGRLLLEKLPFFALAALSSLITLYAQQQAVVSGATLPFLFRLANAARGYVAYLGKTLWPAELAVIYPLPLGLPLWEALGAALLLLLISIGVALGWRRRPYLLVGWCWFLGTLVPVIGLVQVGLQSHADRYTYIPLIGIFLIVAWGGAEIAGRFCPDRRLVAGAAATLLVALAAATTWFQLRHWRNSETLFRHAVQVTPPNAVARLNLGAALENQARYDEAIGQYLEALAINPDIAIAHFNLGVNYRRRGDLDRAVRHFEQVLRLDPAHGRARQELAYCQFLHQQRAAPGR